jgi:hypothetical protein
VSETQFVDVVSKTTKQHQRVPAHYLELAAEGIEPFTDFEPAEAEGKKPTRGSKTKEDGGA